MRVSTGLGAAAIVLGLSPRAAAFDNIVRGATASASFGTTPVGDELMGEIGAAWGGIRIVSDRSWVLQWETLVALKAGYLGSEHPFLPLIGPHLSSWFEGGYRFRNTHTFSPYLGVRLAGDARWLTSPGAASLDSKNAVDGVGGNVARGALRLDAGSSYLEGTRSLIVTPFVQEELDAPELHTPSLAFTELGVAVRYDVARSWMISLDALCGLTVDRRDALRQRTDSTMRCGIAAGFRKIFHNGAWLGASLSWQRDTDHLVYDRGATYETADAPSFVFALSVGLPLWRSR